MVLEMICDVIGHIILLKKGAHSSLIKQLHKNEVKMDYILWS